MYVFTLEVTCSPLYIKTHDSESQGQVETAVCDD